MQTKLDLRPLAPGEIAAARALLPPGAPEPNWKNCRGIWYGDELAAVVGLQQVWRLEPLYVKGEDVLALVAAMTWADTSLREALGAQEYEFFIANTRKPFQDFVERRLPVEPGEERPGKFYFRKLR